MEKNGVHPALIHDDRKRQFLWQWPPCRHVLVLIHRPLLLIQGAGTGGKLPAA
jgi:hypothetical protein